MKKLSIFFLCLFYSLNIFANNSSSKKIEDIIYESDKEELKSENNPISIISRIENLELKVSHLERIVNKITTHRNQSLPGNANNNSASIGSTENSAESAEEEKNSNATQEKKDYDQALAVFKDGHFPQASNLFADFIETYPESKLSSNAYFWYGESFFRQKSFEKAALHYFKGYKKSPKGTKAGDSLLKLSIALGEIKKEKEACTTLEKLKKEFPKRTQLSMKKAEELEKKFSCIAPHSKAEHQNIEKK